MDMGQAFLVSVGQLLLLANIAAAGALIVFFAKFVVELADSWLHTRFPGFTGTGLARKSVAARTWKRRG